jgi:hypothetical protein
MMWFALVDIRGHDSKQLETTDEQRKAETGREYEYSGKEVRFIALPHSRE